MSKGTSSEKPTHDSEKEKRVFSVDMQAMQSLQQAYSEKACVGARADKQHSSNKHCVEMAHAYTDLVQIADVLTVVDVQRETVVVSCDQLLSSMADWLTLFSYFRLRSWDAQQRTVQQQLMQQLDGLQNASGNALYPFALARIQM